MSLAPTCEGSFRARPSASATAAVMTIDARNWRDCERSGLISGPSIAEFPFRSHATRGRSIPVPTLVSVVVDVVLAPLEGLGDAVGVLGPDVVGGDQLGQDPQADELHPHDEQADAVHQERPVADG